MKLDMHIYNKLYLNCNQVFAILKSSSQTLDQVLCCFLFSSVFLKTYCKAISDRGRDVGSMPHCPRFSTANSTVLKKV